MHTASALRKTAFYTLICFVLSNIAFAQTRTLKLIEPRNVPAEQLAPTLRGLISTGSSIQVYNNQLIINASHNEHVAIERALQTLDAQARQLYIFIKRGGSGASSNSQTHVEVSHSNDGTTTTVTTRSQTTQTRSTGTQGIRATEGYPTYISFGEARLLPDSSNSSSFHSANQGFYARVYIRNNIASVSIATSADSFTSNTSKQTQHIVSSVSTPLDQWVVLGSIEQLSQSQGGEHSTSYSNELIYLMVSLTP